MSDITISNLSGYDLFDDAESFMSEINNEATDSIVGGLIIICRYTANCNQETICEVNTVVNNPGNIFVNNYRGNRHRMLR